MTTTTVFPAAGGNDGYLMSHNAVYATALAGSSFTTDTAGTQMYVGQQNQAGDFRAYISYIDFDTSGIPDTDVVSAVMFSMKGLDNGSTTDFVNEVYAYDFSTTITSADWQTPTQVGALTLLASSDSSLYSTNYVDFTSTADFLTAINKTGSTRIIVVSSRFRTSTTPTLNVNEYIGWATADNSGTTSDPKLVVTHAAPLVSAPPPSNFRKFSHLLIR